MTKEWISFEEVPSDCYGQLLKQLIGHHGFVIVRERWQDSPHTYYILEEPEPSQELEKEA